MKLKAEYIYLSMVGGQRAVLCHTTLGRDRRSLLFSSSSHISLDVAKYCTPADFLILFLFHNHLEASYSHFAVFALSNFPSASHKATRPKPSKSILAGDLEGLLHGVVSGAAIPDLDWKI